MVTSLPCSKGRGDELVVLVVVVVVVVVGEREGGTQERGRNGDRGWQCPRRSSVGGREDEGELWPNTKLPSRWCLFGLSGNCVDWTRC